MTAGADTTLNFGKTFANKPVVWTTPQTYNQNGNIAAHVWVEDTATKTTSSTPIIGCVHQGTANSCTGGQPDEEVGYVAIDIANVNISGFQSGSASISNSAWTSASFNPSYKNPRVMVTQNDDNGGQDPEYAWARSITTSGMEFRYCEQDGADDCDSHTGEEVDWFALEQGYITLPGKTLQTIYDVENATTINMSFYISPGEYTWGVQCFDTNGAEGWSNNRTLFVTKPIDMFYPDRAAPGMNFVMTILGEEFDNSDTITTSSSDIVIGKIFVYNVGDNTVSEELKTIIDVVINEYSYLFV